MSRLPRTAEDVERLRKIARVPAVSWTIALDKPPLWRQCAVARPKCASGRSGSNFSASANERPRLVEVPFLQKAVALVDERRRHVVEPRDAHLGAQLLHRLRLLGRGVGEVLLDERLALEPEALHLARKLRN